MSLDLVEAGLQQAGISYLRFDGTLPQKQRQPVIESFRRDPNIKVFLLTLSCGAVGLVISQTQKLRGLILTVDSPDSPSQRLLVHTSLSPTGQYRNAMHRQTHSPRQQEPNYRGTGTRKSVSTWTAQGGHDSQVLRQGYI
jgi:hypothetical protein